MASLATLPAEILSRIAQFLVRANLGFEDDGICNLRLACRNTCLKTQYEFGRAAFSTLRLDFHPETLQQLLIVSKCPAFGEAVKKVVLAHFGDEHISFSGIDSDNEEGLTTLEEQVLYVARRVFQDAFRGLPNLKEILIDVPFIARFQRGSEIAEIDEAVLQPGRGEQKGFKVEEFSITAGSLYSIITNVAFRTGCQLSTIRITHTTQDWQRKNLSAFGVPEDTFENSLPVLKSIQNLDLILYVRPLRPRQDNGTKENIVIKEENSGDATTILRQLVTLRLKFIATRGIASYSSSILDTMCTPNSADLSFLVNLRLSNVSITEEALTSLLLNHKLTLQFLVLGHVQLTGTGRWLSILNVLLDDLPVLNQLGLYSMKERGTHIFALKDGCRRSVFNFCGRESTLAGIECVRRTMFFKDWW